MRRNKLFKEKIEILNKGKDELKDETENKLLSSLGLLSINLKLLFVMLTKKV